MWSIKSLFDSWGNDKNNRYCWRFINRSITNWLLRLNELLHTLSPIIQFIQQRAVVTETKHPTVMKPSKTMNNQLKNLETPSDQEGIIQVEGRLHIPTYHITENIPLFYQRIIRWLNSSLKMNINFISTHESSDFVCCYKAYWPFDEKVKDDK